VHAKVPSYGAESVVLEWAYWDRSMATNKPHLRRSERGLRSPPSGRPLAASAAAVAAPDTTAAAPAAALTPAGLLENTVPLSPSGVAAGKQFQGKLEDVQGCKGG